jgi:ketosteroid isomerase-like protein
MKTTSLALIVALGFAVPVARAQETEAPTAASTPTESTSADVAESPAAKTATKKYPTPGASTSAESSAAPSSTKSSSVAATAKPTTAATGPIVLKGNAEQQIRQIEDGYEAASMAHNIAMIEPFIADDFVLTDSKNRVMNKRATVAEFKKDSDTYTTAKNTEMKMRPVDRDVYVVTGVAHEAGKDKTGKAFDRRYRFTDTFVNRSGKWLVVATHVSTLSSR